ncbi:MAG TPA: type II/IV secretion system protein [Candidatus Marinimicrobia bacterium]|nr:type II/IV secretion system protein [Candidatus Neomarinimicrobiota bacterium]
MVNENLLTNEQVDEAINFKNENRCHFGAACIELGFLTERQVMEVLGIQLYMPVIRISNFNIDSDALEFIPKDRARRLKVIPLFVIEDTLTVATAEPLNITAVDEIRKMSNKRIQMVLAKEKNIELAIDRSYVSTSGYSDEDGYGDEAMVEEAVSDEENIQVADNILLEAVRGGASDIHIEPGERNLRVRLRVDGVLFEFSTMPPSRTPGLVSRFKVMAGIDIAESRKPQDGRFKTEVEPGKPVDVRVSTYPTPHGEKVVMRVLDQSKGLVSIDKMGFDPETSKLWKKAYSSGNGIVLVTGPTGSGKSTTLYATLTRINTVEEHIITIEDPVERQLEGIIQGHVNERAGMTFAAALRSMLRQDPDVIMVGEMRDRETADLAIRAALTGHLVFSTLHTNSAAASYTRLADMGCDPFLLTTTIRAILAQRLVRKLCSRCKMKYRPTEKDLKTLGMQKFDGFIYHANEKGCKSCGKDGYSGRAGLYELLIPNEAINEAVKNEASAEEVSRIAKDNKMRMLIDAARTYVTNGLTSVEEINRVL